MVIFVLTRLERNIFNRVSFKNVFELDSLVKMFPNGLEGSDCVFTLWREGKNFDESGSAAFGRDVSITGDDFDLNMILKLKYNWSLANALAHGNKVCLMNF